MAKKAPKQNSNINKYITEDASDSNDSFEEAQGDFGRSLQDVE